MPLFDDAAGRMQLDHELRHLWQFQQFRLVKEHWGAYLSTTERVGAGRFVASNSLTVPALSLL
jgi:hypothetical protein